MKFEWDQRKAVLNLNKRGVDFADAVTVLYDELALTLPDDRERENRYVTIGMDSMGRILVVAYTWRGEWIRLISARKATPGERRRYEGTQ